jgi:hypothetical protein
MIKPPLNSFIRFRSSGHEATVSEHTTLGFRYVLAHDYPFISRWNLTFSGEGEVFLDEETQAFWEADIEVIQKLSEWPPASQTFQSITYTITNEA